MSKYTYLRKGKKQLNKKRNVLITGASSGIGYELAKIFANNGYNLILVARNKERLEQLRSELHQVKVTILAKDLSSPHAAQELYSQVQALQLPVDILINNAGYGMQGKFHQLDLEKQLNMVHLNIVALMELTHYFVQEMVSRKYGRIMNIGSIASFISTPSMSTYAATKAFVLSFSESLNSELKGKGDLCVTALCPGPTTTNFAQTANIAGDLETAFKRLSLPASFVAQAGYEAMMKKKAVVIPGKRFSLSVTSTRFLSRNMIQRLLSRSNEKEV